MKHNIAFLLATSLILTYEASAKPVSVISMRNIPAYSITPSIQWLEMFPANSRMCIESEPIMVNGGKFLQLILEGQKAYTPLLTNRQMFAPNPSGDPDCNKLAASLANTPQSSRAAAAATGEASAQSSPVLVTGPDGRPLGHFAVIANGSVPYYTGGSLAYVGTTPPQGQFAAGQHLCANWEVTLHGRELINVDLPSGDKADAVYSRETFTPDPANDQKCESKNRQVNSMDGTVIVPNTVTDPALRANIADMAEFIHSSQNKQNLDFFSGSNAQTYNILVNDPGAKNIRTKVAIAEGFYNRGRENNEWIYDDKKFNDLITARLWYQMVLDQIKIEYPNIRNNALRFQSDPSGSIASMVNVVENRIQFCPTALQRQQERAVAEKKKMEAAVQQEEAAKKVAQQEREAAAFQKAADPFDIAYVFRNFITEDTLNRVSVIHKIGVDGRSQQEYNAYYNSLKRNLESMKVKVNDTNKQADGSYIAIITYYGEDGSHTSKVGYLKGADGLVITCHDTLDGKQNCR